MEFGMTGVAGITVICYLAGMLVKASRLPDKWIPGILGVLGGTLGLLGYFCVAGFPAAEPLTAVAVGIASGLAATGANEMVKQMKGD